MTSIPHNTICQYHLTRLGRSTRDLPIVTTALKSPFAIRSISFSICGSVDEGELRMVYDEWARGWDDPGWEVGVG